MASVGFAPVFSCIWMTWKTARVVAKRETNVPYVKSRFSPMAAPAIIVSVVP